VARRVVGDNGLVNRAPTSYGNVDGDGGTIDWVDTDAWTRLTPRSNEV
jgi:hypothetical protein